MVKKALIISACLITIIVIASIIISLVNLKKPLEFKSIVSYDSGTAVMRKAPVSVSSSSSNNSNDDLSLLTNMLKYEKTIMFSTIVLVLIFAILFYGTKRSKGW